MVVGCRPHRRRAVTDLQFGVCSAEAWTGLLNLLHFPRMALFCRSAVLPFCHEAQSSPTKIQVIRYGNGLYRISPYFPGCPKRNVAHGNNEEQWE